MFGLMNKVE